MKKNDLLKIFCLAVGLTLGLVLLAKVCFIDDINSFIPDKERIMYVRESTVRKSDGSKQLNEILIPGGVIPSIAAEMPEVEAATRVTMLLGRDSEKIETATEKINAQIYLADSCFFDVFNLPVLIGDPHKSLAYPGQVMVSRSLAEKLGGMDKVVGKTFCIANDKDFLYTVSGVFEDIPENCSLDFDALASIRLFDSYWDQTTWSGNNQYLGYAKLREGHTAESVKPSLERVVKKHLDAEKVQEEGVEISYNMVSLGDYVKEDTMLQNTKHLLLFLGLALIAVAVLNYLVLIVSTLVNRTKRIAVIKCYGAGFGYILQTIFWESLSHLLLALAIGTALLFLIKDKAEELLQATLGGLFSPKTIVLSVMLILILLAVTTIVPAIIYSKVPVATAFRSERASKRTWKLCLLFLQIASTALVVSLLSVITRQYNLMANGDKGYSYDRVLTFTTYELDDNSRTRVMNELKRLPIVEKVSGSQQLPHYGYSEGCVYKLEDTSELFPFSDFYCVTPSFFDLMEIPVIEGRSFKEKDDKQQVMVSEMFAKKLKERTGLSNVIGQQVAFSGRTATTLKPYTIIGVFGDIMLGSGSKADTFPLAAFPVDEEHWSRPYSIEVKLTDMTMENIERVNALLKEIAPEANKEVVPLKMLILDELESERNFRDSFIICALVALSITLVGLLGYITDEVNRRRKEIAIRKVLGTGNIGILKILSHDITLIAIPALAIGSVIAYYLTEQWLQDYSNKIELSALTFILTALFIYIIIEACVILRAYKAASENPAKNLKSE